jgi:glycosyltransferase involved in cell wall biosynthesis
MNILYVTNTLHKGGAEAHLLLLTQGLQAAGHSCEVAFLRSAVPGGSIDLRASFEAAGIRTHHLHCERSYDPRSATRLHRLLTQRRWDVLHSHLPRADAAAAACRMFTPHGPAWISTVHHPYDNAYSGASLIPALAPMWRMADGLIAVSEPVRRWCIERLGVDVNAVRTIVHGIDVRRAVAPRAPSPTRRRIGAIGRYEERKGHETLIRAMVPVLREFPDAELVIAGHDPWNYGDVLRELIDELGLQRHVQLAGYVDQEEFFSDIDVFAFASLSEGFGIVVLEAMLARRPPVVSNIAPLSDIICPGTSGLVATPNDPDAFAQAILTLLRDPDHLQRMGDAARQRVVAEFSVSRMVERTRDYYQEMIGRTAESAL